MTDSKGPRILYHSDGEYVLRSAYERACEGRNKWKEEYENLCKFANDFEAERDRYRKALEWIAGVDESKPYCTYYERTLDDGSTVPTVDEIAREACKEIAVLSENLYISNMAAVELEKERDRLRAALERITQLHSGHECADIAREALK